MPVGLGSRVGPYEVTALLGEGGMGKVWRAHHTALKRDDALKVLPDAFVSDPERLARFQREAQVLASLNHPNIAHVHGLERSDGVQALVMELVEGPTLADRIAQGAIPVDEALPIAKQIAEALETAHEQGIIHRDLKPANIKVRPDGTVKVLDFGLAKALEPVVAGTVDATASPTITSPAMMTGAGMILGTAAYMAPEQARGKGADRRSDVWAFGCVLYEVLTGRRPFEAEEVADTLALVLTKTPDWTQLPATTPDAIRTLLRRCLERDRKRRLPDMGAARLEIEDAIAASESRADGPDSSSSRRWRLAAAGAALVALAAIAIAAFSWLQPPPARAASIRFDVSPPPGMTFAGETAQGHWISPDGRHIAFRVTRSSSGVTGLRATVLAVRSFHESNARPLPGTEGVAEAFWSPDSQFLGFFADGKLKKVALSGGPAVVLCDAPLLAGGAPMTTGGTWNADGTIVFGMGGNGESLMRVSAGGGAPSPVTTLDAARKEIIHSHPSFLPDGRHFLYVASSGQASSFATRELRVGSLDGDAPLSLGPTETKGIYVDGFVLLVRQSTLVAQAFDLSRLGFSGDPIVLAQNVDALAANGSFSASPTGTLSYRSPATTLNRLTWFSRRGERLGDLGEPGDFSEMRLSPDGTRVAVSVFDAARGARDLWIYDVQRSGVQTRLTFDPGEDWTGVWSPDGRTIVFSGARPAALNLYRKNADGTGNEEQLIESDGINRYVSSWSPDGQFILYNTGGAGSQSGNDLWTLSLRDRKAQSLLQGPAGEVDPAFSPDGRWVAYRSNEFGRNEIYVIPFGSAGGRWQISTAGGEYPRWRGDGKELFFWAGTTLMAAAIDVAGSAPRVGEVRRLFDVPRRTVGYRGFGTDPYDVAADGQRFLINVLGDEDVAPPPITVITNWTTMLP